MKNDRDRARICAKEHWHVAVFACLCLPVLGAILVDLHIMSLRGAVAACLASVVYIGLTTWLHTRKSDPPDA